ncbi:MAG: glycosyltransferase family 4 protein [Fuerstiella sp.]|nr:glycosyltransferase family 4 protein [Fuerstiella sp.]
MLQHADTAVADTKAIRLTSERAALHHVGRADGSNTPSVLERFFRGKRVLVISPQPWDSIHLSKHHYAKEIAQYADKLFFLEPPRPQNKNISVNQLAENENITIVSCSEATPRWVRFKARWLYRYWIKYYVGQLTAVIGEVDVVWCFDTNLYPDPRRFGGTTTLYHVVDPVPYQRQIAVGAQTDAVVCISPRILKRFDGILTEHRKLVVNHGLSDVFLESNAQFTEQTQESANGIVRFGYCGNLTRAQIDHESLRLIIDRHPDVEFHFWGPYEGSDAGSSPERFVRYLQSKDNVLLHGRVSTAELAVAIQDMSGFLLAYRADNLETDNSNSHKILEYLSTGKVIVSKSIEYYHGSPLFETAADESVEAFVTTFTDVLRRIDHCNRPELSAMRRDFAASQTYAGQLGRIISFLMNTTVKH